MTEAYVLTFAQNALFITLLLAGPALLGSLIIGSLVSLFQAATKINEVTLTFIPKIVVISLILITLGSWMGQQMLTYTANIFSGLATMPK
jgi:flagellar biosynthesis protein FliQ